MTQKKKSDIKESQDKKTAKTQNLVTKKSSNEANKQLTQITEVFEKLPEEQKKEFIGSLIVSRQEFSGPIPHPNILGQYGKVGKDYPERIMRMAEKELDNSIDINDRTMRLKERQQEINHQEQNKGANYAIGVTIGLFVVAMLFIYMGKDIAGIAMLFPVFGQIIITWLTAYKSKSNNHKNQ